METKNQTIGNDEDAVQETETETNKQKAEMILNLVQSSTDTRPNLLKAIEEMIGEAN